MSNPRMATKIESEAKPKRYVFVLLEDFTLLSFASALESLRIANRMAGHEAYQWRIIGEGGEEVCCSAGSVFKLDGDLDELSRDDTMMICSGVNVQQFTTKSYLVGSDAKRAKEYPLLDFARLHILWRKLDYWTTSGQPFTGKIMIAFQKSFQKLNLPSLFLLWMVIG